MSLILCIETATETCSVALAENGVLLDCKEITEPKEHATSVHNFIKEVMDFSNRTFNQLDAVCVSKGPGSYTGLRIGTSAAKGICFALDIPLISINTLQSYTGWFIQKNESIIKSDLPPLFCPMLDARRQEVYTSILDSELNFIEPTQALILAEESFENYRQKNHLFIFGSGSKKYSESLLNKENVTFVNNFKISACGLIHLAFKKFTNREFEDLAYFEPYYLKEFVAKLPNKQL